MTSDAVSKLRVTTDRRDGIAVIVAMGEVDLETADTLAAALRSQIAAGVGGIVLDLLEVPFMDSSGLKQLLAASNEMRERLIVVLGPASPVRRLLELAEIADRISLRTSVDDAVAELVSREG
jgi:stage II sporulation protein AA (anti-sigma F factor antagonist)